MFIEIYCGKALSTEEFANLTEEEDIAYQRNFIELNKRVVNRLDYLLEEAGSANAPFCLQCIYGIAISNESPEQGLKLVEKLAGKYSDRPDVYLALGMIYGGAKELDYYKQALEIDNQYVPALYLVAKSEKDEGYLDLAESHLRQAIKIYPGFIDAHYELGHLLSALGRTDEAKPHLQKTIQEKQGDKIGDYAESILNGEQVPLVSSGTSSNLYIPTGIKVAISAAAIFFVAGPIAKITGLSDPALIGALAGAGTYAVLSAISSKGSAG